MDNNSLQTIVCSIELRNFRCFDDKKISLDAPIVIIQGANGSGKTSLIEALYFSGHMRSCKTAHADHLIKQKENAFFLKVHTVSNDIFYIGVEHKKKVVRVNQKQLKSLKELQSLLTIISIVDTDILIVQGGPVERRLFLDEALLLLDHDAMALFKKLRTTVKQRNTFLQRGIQNETLYMVLTEQLIEYSSLIQKKRIQLLKMLTTHINILINEYELKIAPITLQYTPKKDFTFQPFDIHQLMQYAKNEYLYGRSLFGAHLDDFELHWQSFDVRKHCSRGQQKLLVMLLKISLAKLCNTHNKQILLLIDDFVTDFDRNNIQTIMTLFCAVQGQIIYTCPLISVLDQYIPPFIARIIVDL